MQAFLLQSGIPALLFLVTVAAVAVYGLQNQYFNKLAFGALGDWVTLFAWGFGTGLAGRAIGDLIGMNPATTKPAASGTPATGQPAAGDAGAAAADGG
jgi:hypothetical protein